MKALFLRRWVEDWVIPLLLLVNLSEHRYFLEADKQMLECLQARLF